MADLDRRRSVALLLLILALATGLRLAGYGWGGSNLLHPDERFLAMVTTSLEPNARWLDYFDTRTSTLNPENVGSRPNFVYGTYPLILVRLLGEATRFTGLVELTEVGRFASAGWDLLTLIAVFALGARLADRRTGLLAAFFLAVTVLHIQQSHYFTVDLAQTFFVTVALLLAVRIAEPDNDDRPSPVGAGARLREARLGLSLAFGLAAAAAVAAKLSAAPVVLLLPAAHLLRVIDRRREERAATVLPVLVVLTATALTFGLGFRVLQPYAFAGPGLFDLSLNPRWVNAIDSLRSLTSVDADWPPAMQWARRSVLYSGRNLVLWGFGLPLGVLALAGVAAAARRAFRSGNRPLILAVGWTVGYFAWQSLANNPTMRYQLPVYPALAFFAAWGVTALWQHGTGDGRRPVWRRAAVVVAMTVGVASLLYALGFTGIYLQPITREAASRWLLAEVPGPVNLIVETDDGTIRRPVAIPYEARIERGLSLETRVGAPIAGTIRRLTVPHLVVGRLDQEADTEPAQPGLRATLTVENRKLEASSAARCGPAGEAAVFECVLELDRPIEVTASDQLRLTLELLGADGLWARPEGGAIANETGWDDGLPLRIDGYDPYGGVYQRDLTLELYWNDDEAKRERMLGILDRADVLVISSNRQWGSLPRIPERFPLVTAYYRHLVGCPPERSVVHCLIEADVGMVPGDLGFKLAAVFASPPRLGPFAVNDQSADEAFTVYDHPKVMLFTKTADYDPARVRAILEQVDLSRVVNQAPGHFGRQPADLMLPADRVARQRVGGTWRDRFPPTALVNRHPAMAVIAWYVALTILGLGVSPLIRWALPGLADRGLPLARGFGLLAVAWLVWMIGSAGITVSPWTVRLVMGALVAGGVAVVWRRRSELAGRRLELGRLLLTSEVVFAVFFAIALTIRCVNPDLWHPAHGGEKPMDLSYFTAVLKSVTFPPYDPWFAGGYINYYYFGFVIVGQLALALGIRPDLAYNLALPTLIALAAAAAFSVAGNVVAAGGEAPVPGPRRRLSPTVAGWLAATAVTLFGNLHPVRMLVTGLADLGAAAGRGAVASVVAGIARVTAGQHLAIPAHHWFWNPTRIIPDPDVMPITEFPAFTLIYGDLHAHLMDLPQVLLAMAFALAVLVGWSDSSVGRGRRLAAVFLGALAIGAMRPTNTWSYYPFLALGCVAVALGRLQLDDGLPERPRLLRAALWTAGFALLTRLLYLPFDAWFGMGYSEIIPWDKSHTPLAIYLEHWAPFLFPVATWLVLEVRDWLAATPLAAVRPLKQHLHRLLAIGVPTVGGMVMLVGLGVRIGWLAWPMIATAGVLLLRRDLPPARRFALLVVGLALALTVVVELVTLKFDLGRMNTVFKFYYVSWALLAVAAAACVWWRAARRFTTPARAMAWWLVAGSLLAGAALYPLRAVPAKAADRMASGAPCGLDGLAYLEVAVHHDQGRTLNLAEDLAAIRWLRRNVDGTPVIVEANIPEYRWGSRITINTGLPGVVGWNWHQRQQRAVAGDKMVWDRVHAVTDFYNGVDRDDTIAFLERYNVAWIVVGQLERAYYPPEGLAKFEAWDGDLWREAFRSGETVIYEVVH